MYVQTIISISVYTWIGYVQIHIAPIVTFTRLLKVWVQKYFNENVMKCAHMIKY